MEEKLKEKIEEKREDSKNMVLKIKSIRRLFYLGTILLIFTSLLPNIILYIYPEIHPVELLVVSAIMFSLVMVFYGFVLYRLSSMAKGITSPTESLAEKMMKCKLRIENGLDYCVKCPDGYACASGKEILK